MHLVNGDAWKRKALLTLKSGFGFSFGFRVFIGGPILWVLFFFSFFCFSLVFPRKTAVSLCFGRIWRDFPWFSYEKTCFLLFLGFS